jgi:hypothetical protein
MSASLVSRGNLVGVATNFIKLHRQIQLSIDLRDREEDHETVLSVGIAGANPQFAEGQVMAWSYLMRLMSGLVQHEEDAITLAGSLARDRRPGGFKLHHAGIEG